MLSQETPIQEWRGDLPTVEARILEVILLWDGSLVERFVMWMLQLRLLGMVR
jgi:hypothetical protein